MTGTAAVATGPVTGSARVGRGPLGLGLVGVSVGLVAVTGGLGESAATRMLGSGGRWPPYALPGHPSPWLVTLLLVAATLTGTAGSLLAWSALARGWAPPPRRLLAAGLVAAFALLLVPPTSSDDLYSYTAYGRIAALGRDPYTTAPADLGDDPVGREAGDPWRDQPSVYGPLATWEQELALRVAGPDPRAAAALLALASAVAFGGVGLLLHRAAGTAAAQRRAALLWTLNPLLLLHLVAGAHVDALPVLLTVAGVLAWRRRPFVAGLLGGAAVGVKLSGALAAAALAWTELRNGVPIGHRTPGAAATSPAAAPAPATSPAAAPPAAGRRRLALLVLGGVLVTPPAYLLAGGLQALGPVRRASRFVSFGSPWRALSVPLDHFGVPRAVVSTLSLLVVATFVVLLSRGLSSGPDTSPAVRATAVATLAWLLGATYVLPWYDAWAWPLLALLPASRWDRWLAVRTAVLTLAYLPGRIVPMPPLLGSLLFHLRAHVTPVALGLLLVVAVRWCRAPARHGAQGGPA
ncbi:MAG TPA: polyprenol phosphomannose-dependent alpha 1,6 mannosyltransferase MptB [Mycobacteriales bacterium]|nr:polyprenol phosphomannose-dependent alpha 1,6 mannosyltransferase MptB [Mycobacteriales bacterium]